MTLLIYTANERYSQWRQAFAEAAPELDIVYGAQAANSQVKYSLTWAAPHGFLKTLPNLRAMFSMGAGVDHLTADPELPELPIIRQRDAGMGVQMAEYSLYAALHYQRDFDLMRDCQRRAQWDPNLSVAKEKIRIGILGLGTLGTKVAQSMIANGFPVNGWSRNAKDQPGVDCYVGLDELPIFLSRTDLLICLLPDTAATRGIVDRTLLQQLPQGAAIVNVARGALVIDEDLLTLLDAGHIRGAMLDVFHLEPLPSSHPYWTHPKVVVTPHIAAETIFTQSAHQVAAEIARMESGLAPTEVVDLARGY